MMTLIGIGVWGLITFGFIMAFCWTVMLAISIGMIIYIIGSYLIKLIRFLIKGDK